MQWQTQRGGYVLVRHDATREIELQRKALTSERLAGLGTVAMGLGHELNNPLGIILAAAGALQRRHVADSQLQRLVQVIVDEVERCRRITHALLDYGRAPDREGRHIALRPLLQDVPSRMNATHPWAVVSLDLAGDGNVIGNEDDLVRLFSNLTDNAIVAAPGLPVAITLRELPGYALITVENGGPEIPGHVTAKLFEPFFTTKPHGTGLGLAFAHKIVQMMQGQLWYARENDKNVFHVKLPVVET